LFEVKGDVRFADAAGRAMEYLRCRHEVHLGNRATRGGVAGSFPIDAPYCRLQFLNWAAKFFVDALLLEERLKPIDSGPAVHGEVLKRTLEIL
jgi:hypothetical protein